MTTVFLLRHAESAPDRDLDEAEWPLSADGERQAIDLRDYLVSLDIDRIFSSPFARAIATVRPFADRIGRKVEIVSDLRERKLKEGFIDNWLDTLKRSWTDFDFALPNCESGTACQGRVKRCIDGLVARDPGRRILISSHGNAIGLYLNTIDPSFGFDGWAAMRNPDLFRIVYRSGAPTWDMSFVYPQGVKQAL